MQFLRGFRDHLVLSTTAGSAFMEVFNAWYYSFSPSVAGFIAANDPIRAPVRVFLYPLLGVLGTSAFVYSALSASPEFAVIVAGLVASSLIGLVYLTLPAIIGFRTLTRRRIRITSIAKASLTVLAIALGLLVVGELAKANDGRRFDRPHTHGAMSLNHNKTIWSGITNRGSAPRQYRQLLG